MTWRSVTRILPFRGLQRKATGALEADRVSWTLWSRYAFGILSIVALLVANHFASAFSLASGAQDEELINISGRQRMLSQRILFLSERYVMTGDEADLARLSSAVQVFHSSHELLAEEAARDPDLAEYYDFGRSSGLDERARAYVFIATDITAGTATPAVSVMQVNTLVRMGRDSLLGELNAAVTGFETVANNRAGQLKLVQNVTLAMALFIILLEFLLIFRPLNRWVVQTVRRLDRDANFDALTGWKTGAGSPRDWNARSLSGPRRVRWWSSPSTSTASRPSMTSWATPPGTMCCGMWRGFCRRKRHGCRPKRRR
jgi:hypothetical protein